MSGHRFLVTGSAGTLGAALVRDLRAAGLPVRGIDLRPSDTTDALGSISDAAFVRAQCDRSIGVLLHCATLHRPQLATHTRQQFIDSNVGGTLQLLEAALAVGVRAVVLTSSTSLYGDAMQPAPGAPAAWVDESLLPQPRHIYGASKLAAEALCESLWRSVGLPCVVLRTGRFFAGDPAHGERDKAVEYLHRRVALADVVAAHRLAAERAPALGFGRFVISAASPFTRGDVAALGHDAATLIEQRLPGSAGLFAARGWALPSQIDRVYDSTLARQQLGWLPRTGFAEVLARLRQGLPVPG